MDSLAAFKTEWAQGAALTNLISLVNHPNARGHALVLAELIQWFPAAPTEALASSLGVRLPKPVEPFIK